MPVVAKSALVRHSAEEMFALVKDVAAYQEFLPWCHSSRVLSEGDNEVCGEIVVSRIGVRQAFSTCNRYVPGRSMEIRLRDGPFKRLEGHWRFLPLRTDACKVELELEFEFAGGVIDKAFGAVFAQVANTLVDSFCKRAEAVYGRGCG